jgi:hypothetical protein
VIIHHAAVYRVELAPPPDDAHIDEPPGNTVPAKVWAVRASDLAGGPSWTLASGAGLGDVYGDESAIYWSHDDDLIECKPTASAP